MYCELVTRQQAEVRQGTTILHANPITGLHDIVLPSQFHTRAGCKRHQPAHTEIGIHVPALTATCPFNWDFT
jgi:hypothetical protein